MEKLFYKPSKKLYCFTPEVMLTTFIIESVLAVYTFARYRMSVFGRTAAFTIFLLSIFQISEYLVCTGGDQMLWARIGFASITLLPVLGVHLISFVAGAEFLAPSGKSPETVLRASLNGFRTNGDFKNKHFLFAAYALAFMYIGGFLFSSTALSGAVCVNNYIIFLTGHELWWTYIVYYFFFLFLGVWNGIHALVRQIGRTDARTYGALAWFLVGYLSFLLPMAVIYIVYPETRNAAPSIMCGFALIYALILSLRVLPAAHTPRA